MNALVPSLLRRTLTPFRAVALARFQAPMKFSAVLPDGEVRKFAFPETFNSYVAGFPDADFLKVWPLKFCCLIQSREAPF